MGRISATKGKRAGFFLWARDWLTSESVRTMPPAARSMYLDLLAFQSLSDGLPADIEKLARLLSYPQSEFERHWVDDRVKDQFELIDGRLFNPRLRAEMLADEAFRAIQSLNGKLGGRPRGKANGNPTGNRNGSQTRSEKNPPSPSPSSEKTVRKGNYSTPAQRVDTDVKRLWRSRFPSVRYPGQVKALEILDKNP